jgi:hypothetical protein
MREAGLFLVFACQEGDVDLACRLLMRMVVQAARAPGVDMTRLCHCTLRPKRSTAQQGVPWFGAECRILRACYRHSRLRGTPRERACLQAQYRRLLRAKRTAFNRCKARLLLAKVRANRGLAVKGFLPTHTCACDSPSLGPFHSGSLPWWTICKGSVRSADKCYCRGSSNLLYHAVLACGYLCCATCYPAHT